MPGGKVLETLCNMGVNASWVLTGEGSMKLPESLSVQSPPIESPAVAYADEGGEDDEDLDVEDLDPDEFWSLFNEFMRERPARRGWMQIELPRRFPEFDDWLKKRMALAAEEAKKRSKAVGD